MRARGVGGGGRRVAGCGDDDLLTVGERAGEVQRGEAGVGQGAAGQGDGVAHPAAARQPVHARHRHVAGDVNDQLGGRGRRAGCARAGQPGQQRHWIVGAAAGGQDPQEAQRHDGTGQEHGERERLRLGAPQPPRERPAALGGPARFAREDQLLVVRHAGDARSRARTPAVSLVRACGSSPRVHGGLLPGQVG